MPLSKTGIQKFFLVTLLALAAPCLGAQAEYHPDELALKPKIDAAIDRGVEYLLEQQFRDGSWGLHAHLGGRAGLTLYTLLQCGVSRDHPAVRRAIGFLDSVDPTKTYAAATMLLAYDALRMDREDRIEQLVQKLIEWQKPQGDWGYPNNHADLSNTQYAALGLWIAIKHDLDVDREILQKLIDRIADYQEKAQLIDNPDLKNGRTGVTKVEVAGFRYRPNNNGKATGSMTSAGVAVLAIAKAGYGKRLSSKTRRQIDDMAERGMRWLEVNFSVDRNPNGGHHLYYLYGLERVGALMKTERIGPHWWYLEGAKHLLKKQKKDNSWGDVTDTCFALLFLRRATSGRAASTGSSGEVAHVFEAGGENADVRLRGAGQRPLSLYIDGFGGKVLASHNTFGLRVVSVRYEDERGTVLAKVAGDPTKAWNRETFLHRDEAISRGSHKVRARVTVMAPDAGPESDDTEELTSPWMEVKIRDVMAPWMVNSASAYKDNLLRDEKVEYFASTELNKQSGAANVCDGNDGTCWIAAAGDQNPSIRLEWKGSVRVGSITVMLPAQHESKLKSYSMVEGVEVRLGNDRNDEWQKIPIGLDPIAPLVLELERSRRLREIEVRFYGRKDPKKQIGLAEIILLEPKRRR